MVGSAMGQEFRHRCPVETWRLLGVIVTLFAVIITFQYFELPYGRLPSSLSRNAAGNGSFSTENTGLKPEIISDPFSGLNYSIPEGMKGFGNSSQIDDYDDEPSPDRFGVTNEKSSLSPIDARPPSVEIDSPNVNPTAIPDNNSDSSPEAKHTDESIRFSRAGDSSPNITFQSNVESNLRTPQASVAPDVSRVKKDSFQDNGRELVKNLTTLPDNHQIITIPEVKEIPPKRLPAVVSISEMKDLLLQSRSSPNSVRPLWSSPVDEQLLFAKSQIMDAPLVKDDPVLYAPLYRNVSMFKRSYELMEEMLKVYIYKEGERPIFHRPLLDGIYASEGWFMKHMESNKKFVTKESTKAHLFYLPFGSRYLRKTLYVVNSHSHKNLIEYLKKYVDMIAARYSFWNRTGGSDHFLVACHDWAASVTRVHMANCIRALCNADVKEGYVFGKDVSLPETYVRAAKNPLGDVGGKPPSKRSVLAFFAGSMHGYLQPILLQHWENKDPDMKIFGGLPKTRYIQYMKSSKYCICAKGYEVNSPRVVEAIMHECVPVIISDNFVPPFFEILDWESFSVFVAEKDIPNLKNILVSIPQRKYRSLQLRVKKVQRHFLWHLRPEKYDIFHMTLHSIWYMRVFQMQP